MSRDDKRKDLRLVKPREDVEPEALDEATDALRAAMAPPELPLADHEALIAMTLGEDVARVDDEERGRADALRRALEGDGGDAQVAPLVELAVSLKAAHRVCEPQQPVATLEPADHEALLAMTLGDGVAEPSAREREQAERLRIAMQGGGDHPLAELASALRAVAGDGRLDGEDCEILIAMTVGDAVAEVDVRAADVAALGRALDGEGTHPLAELAGAVRAAAGRGGDLDELSHRRLVKRALESRPAQALVERARRRRIEGRRSSAMVIGAIVALAAGIALFVGSLGWLETMAKHEPVAQAPAPKLIHKRSTAELFDPMTKFPSKGGESERMGKIVAARAADLRANRFAAWGVR